MKFLFKLKKARYLLFLIMILSLLMGCSSLRESIESSSYDDTDSSYVDSSYDTEEIEEDASESENEENQDEEGKHYSASNDKNNKNEFEYNENPHFGEYVYIANGNSYYHKIYNCKYLEGANTTKVVLDSSVNKYECNCFQNPVVYKPPVNNTATGTSGGSGVYVYIANGNSYYHKSESCKFISGASVSRVDLNNVGGKHPCNCVKY